MLLLDIAVLHALKTSPSNRKAHHNAVSLATSSMVVTVSTPQVLPVKAGAAGAGPLIPNWSLLRGRAAQSPVDDALRRHLVDIFFPHDAVSVDISPSSPLPFANELRDLFSVYAEKQVSARFLNHGVSSGWGLMRRSF